MAAGAHIFELSTCVAFTTGFQGALKTAVGAGSTGSITGRTGEVVRSFKPQYVQQQLTPRPFGAR
jgi:hypothetical protein